MIRVIGELSDLGITIPGFPIGPGTTAAVAAEGKVSSFEKLFSSLKITNVTEGLEQLRKVLGRKLSKDEEKAARRAAAQIGPRPAPRPMPAPVPVFVASRAAEGVGALPIIVAIGGAAVVLFALLSGK